MILKGSQRGGGRQLAAHLLNDKDKDSNDHIAVEELRGFVAQDLKGALDEMRAVAKGTRCRQFMFSLSLNPPKDAQVGLDTLVSAADRAEEALGLKDQPRAIVVHEKEGRRHIHVVWSRIDAAEMKAINLPHFKNRLRDLSKELYLENEWELPDGHKTNGWKSPLNFSLAEWQQAKRLDFDPREIKQIFRESWEVSDNLASFRNALEEHGFYLAKGDRRSFVALDIHGEAFSLSRWSGLKSKELTGKLGKPDALPSVENARADTRKRLTAELRAHIRQDREAKRQELEPLLAQARKQVAAQRSERLRLDKGLRERQDREAKERAGRFRRGLSGVLDLLTGRTIAIRRANEREAYGCHLRDRALREGLFSEHIKERKATQRGIDAMRTRHRDQRLSLARQIAAVLRMDVFATRRNRDRHNDRGPERERERSRGPAP